MTSPPAFPAVSSSTSALGRGALLACAALTVISGTTLAPALPSIRHSFAALPGIDWLVRLVVTTPALAIALAAPWAGQLTDRVGRRRILLSCLALYAVSGASGLVAGELWEILFGRALLGISAAGIMTASTAIAASTLDTVGRSRFFARQASVMSLAGVASVAVGGLLAAKHWRAPFALHLTALPIALIVLGCVGDGPCRRDVIARSEEREELGAGDARTVEGSRFVVYALAVIAMGFVFMVPLQVPFLPAIRGARIAGFAVATSSLAAAGSSLLMGRLQARSTAVTWVARSFLVMGAGYLLVGATDEMAVIFVGLAIGGVGVGWVMPELSRALLMATPAKERSAAIGALTACVYAGQFLSPALSALYGASRSPSVAFLVAGVTLLSLTLALRRIARDPPFGGNPRERALAKSEIDPLAPAPAPTRKDRR